MIKNKIHHLNFLDNDLPDKCAQLIISDPPYYKVKGEFDFIWKTFDDYLADVEKWAIECKRVLADNGTLLWYGSAKNIAYAQIIFDKHFNLINNLVWNKGYFMGLEESEGLRSFAPCTERILMYSNDFDVNSLDEIMFNPDNFKSIKEYLKGEKFKVMNNFNFTSKQFNEYTLKLGCSTTPYKNWFCNTGFWEMATEKMYNKLQISGFFQKPYEELRKEYEELRKEYEEQRRPFNNVFNLQEVLNFSNEQSKTGAKYDHDTVKPEMLTRALILTCSRKNDLVVVPFAGSGTECAMSKKEGRDFWGCDIEKKYVDMGNKRCDMIHPSLF
jgi:site-specific DNA-methyltransferase (adenine-specific)